MWSMADREVEQRLLCRMVTASLMPRTLTTPCGARPAREPCEMRVPAARLRAYAASMEATTHTPVARPELYALCIAATDPRRLAGFWHGLLGWPFAEGTDADAGVGLLPPDGTGFRLRFLPTDEPKLRRNQIHLDLTSTSPEAQEATVARALELGGRHYDVGQRGDEGHIVLADPEDNEFCVIEPGNRFLAGCPVIGALSS